MIRGTNAHAILETWENNPVQGNTPSADLPVYSPFIFSANSEESLVATISTYADYLRENPSINLRDLAYTLQARRSTFPVRIRFPALSVDSLISAIQEKVKVAGSGTAIGTRPDQKLLDGSGILGIFTGQGAQVG